MMGLGGFGPPSRAPEAGKETISVNWALVKSDFLKWLKSKAFCSEYLERIVVDLDKRVKVIAGPMDVVELFSGLSSGQRHNLDRAVRNLFNFCESMGWDESFLRRLRKALPRDEVGVDIRVPSEAEVVASLRRLSRVSLRYRAFYNLLLDSGLRLTEVARLLSDFKAERAEHSGGFVRCGLGYFRGSKLAYFAYFTQSTYALIRKIGKDEFCSNNASAHAYRLGLLPGKYLRKFAFDKMIELEFPESIADFIQGRVPVRVGAKHYMALMRRADQFYPRYAKYITHLRQKAFN